MRLGWRPWWLGVAIGLLWGFAPPLDGHRLAVSASDLPGERSDATVLVQPFTGAHVTPAEARSLETSFAAVLEQTHHFARVVAADGKRRADTAADLIINGEVVNFVHKSRLSQSWFFLAAAPFVPLIVSPVAAAPASFIHEANFLTTRVTVTARGATQPILVAASSSRGDCLTCVVENVDGTLATRIVYDPVVVDAARRVSRQPLLIAQADTAPTGAAGKHATGGDTLKFSVVRNDDEDAAKAAGHHHKARHAAHKIRHKSRRHKLHNQ